MEKQPHNLSRIILPIVITLLFLFAAEPTIAATTRVAILPFDVNAEKDLTFLQEGIVDMLASRIEWRDRVEVIDKSEIRTALAQTDNFDGESRALLVGGKLKADYVLFGSITVLGESVSIDAKMVDVNGQQPPMPFFAQTSSMGGVIPQINQFATNINQTVFGRGTVQRPATQPAAQPNIAVVPVPQGQPTAPDYDPRMHPEKLLHPDDNAAPRPPAGTTVQNPVPATAGTNYQAPNPAFVVTAPATASTADQEQTFWRSRNFKALITGLAIADVDNDSRKELVVVSGNEVSIYRMENGRLIKKEVAADSGKSTYISVDAADVNGNGTPELYISSLGSGNTIVDSFVLEYSGDTYKTISDGNNWYYRVATTPDKGNVLLGQRHRYAAESIFLEPILEMNWQGDRIAPGRQVLPGRKANLMGMAYGDITQTGSSVVVAYNEWDKIRIYRTNGEKIWEDTEHSGGNKLYFNLPKVDSGMPNRQYFPARIRIVDMDKDGKAEVLIARHEELSKNMLKDLRVYNNGKIVSMRWNGMGLVPQWETQGFQGRASDFLLGDIDNDGTDELVVAIVVKEGSIILTDAISKIIAFDLKP